MLDKQALEEENKTNKSFSFLSLNSFVCVTFTVHFCDSIISHWTSWSVLPCLAHLFQVATFISVFSQVLAQGSLSGVESSTEVEESRIVGIRERLVNARKQTRCRAFCVLLDGS